MKKIIVNFCLKNLHGEVLTVRDSFYDWKEALAYADELTGPFKTTGQIHHDDLIGQNDHIQIVSLSIS